MSYCDMQKCDYPWRVQFGPGLVVHAARETKKHASVHYGPRDSNGNYIKTPIPERMAIRLACSWRKEPSKDNLVENTTSITCKNCAREIGMSEPKPKPKRYIIIRNDTGEYYKKAGWCPKWVKDPTNATLYKVRAVAEKFTVKTHYLDVSGNNITHHEYIRGKRAGEKVTSERKKDPNYDVKTVTITID